MSVADPDPNEIFMQIMEGVVLEEPTDAVNYTLLDDVELSKAKASVRAELFAMGEIHNHNARGRAADLHSQFSAINAEMRRRWPTADDT
jgi:hypothetical protein